MNDPVVVLGAGPAGLACALRLAELGHPPVVVERSPVIGGLSRSIEFGGRTVDLGPHFFASGNDELAALRASLLGDDEIFLRQSTRMYWRGRRLAYPPGLGDVAASAGPLATFGFGVSYLRQQLRRPRQGAANYGEQATRRFGRRFFDSCLRDYVEKLWGMPCEQLDASWEPGRIRATSMASVLSGLLRGRRDDCVMSVGRHGSGQFYAAMGQRAVDLGASIRLGVELVGIDVVDDTVRSVKVRTGDGVEDVPCRAVVSTIPLPALLALLAVPEVGMRPRFRSTVVVFVEVPGTGHFPEQSIYVNDPSLAIGRVGNFANWGEAMGTERDSTVISAEIWCDAGDGWWTVDDEEVVAVVLDELARTGLVVGAEPLDVAVYRLPNTHPVPALGADPTGGEHLGALARFVNLWCTGRAGAFAYRDQDTTILMGLRTADEVAASRFAVPVPGGSRRPGED